MNEGYGLVPIGTAGIAVTLPCNPTTGAHDATFAPIPLFLTQINLEGRSRVMPIVLWLLGVPLSVIVVLWLVHVI